MPDDFLPVWMSVGEAESFRDWMSELAADPTVEFPERQFEIIDSALREEPRFPYEEMASLKKILESDGGRNA